MRILYLGNTDLPQTKARAIQIVHTCHALARAGAEVTLIGGRRGGGSVGAVLREYGLEPHPGLRLIRVPILRIPPTAPPRVLAQFTRAWQASYLSGLAATLPIEVAARRPDAIFARDLRTARLAAPLAHRIGAKLVVEVHGLPSFEVAHGAGRASLPASEASRLRALEDVVFTRADRIVTITECAREILLSDYGLPPERVRTVADATTVRPLPTRSSHPAGTKPSPEPSVGMSAPESSSGNPSPQPSPRGRGSLSPEGANLPLPLGEGWGEGRGEGAAPTASRPCEGAAPERPSIYYVGQLYPWKGAGLVVEVAARVPEADVVIVGGQTNWTQDDPDIRQLATRAEQLGVRERVQLRGHVPYDRVPEALAHASVALLPLPDEPVARLFTSPLKLFDYMAAGVPIVASDLAALREVLRHNENALLAPPGDPDAFAEAVRRLLADPEFAARLGRQARADVAAYSWDARAEALLDFLLEPASVPGWSVAPR